MSRTIWEKLGDFGSPANEKAKQKSAKRRRRRERRKVGAKAPSPAKKVRSKFYASREWLAIRFEALKTNDGKCELCGSSKHDGARLHVDHIVPRSKCPARELDLTNLQVLCHRCNLGKSNRDDTDWRSDLRGGDDWWNHMDPLN